jgi:hypothetical protein
LVVSISKGAREEEEDQGGVGLAGEGEGVEEAQCDERGGSVLLEPALSDRSVR